MKPVKPAVPPSRPADDDIVTADSRKTIANYQRRICEAIFRISEKARNDEKHRLDSYIRHCSPSLRLNGESELPDSLRRSVRNPDRTTTLIYPGILFFHCGNAVVTFYDLCNGKPVLDALERRTALLEKIGKCGPRQFDVIGSEANGYELIHKDDRPVPFLAPGGRNDERNTETL